MFDRIILGFILSTDHGIICLSTNAHIRINHPPMPFRRAYVTAFDNFLFVYGGGNQQAGFNLFHRYDPRSHSPARLPSSQYQKKRCALVAYTNSIYVIGGHYGSSSKGGEIVFIFSLESGCWETGPDLNYQVSCHAAAVFEDRIYISGGKERPSDVWSINALALRWTEEKPLNRARYDHRMVAVGARLYVIGGRVGDTNQFQECIEMFSKTIGAWTLCRATLGCNMPGVLAWEGQIYIFPRASDNYRR